MRFHTITSLSTTFTTIFTILTFNHVLPVQAKPQQQPSKASIFHVRHIDNLNLNTHLPKPTPPAKFLLQHAKEPITITISTITITITATTTPSNTPASSSAPSFLNPALFTSALLNSTNFYRAQHNASAVIYNDTLSSFASHYLDKLGLPSSSSSSSSSSSKSKSKSSSTTTKCELTHSHGPYGENLALGCSDVQSCVEMWGDERAKYDFGSQAKFGEDTGHFTQLVWKDTTDVGCAARWCQGWNAGRGGWYLVSQRSIDIDNDTSWIPPTSSPAMSRCPLPAYSSSSESTILVSSNLQHVPI
ncbi:PR-1-like protein [Neurospora tetrasperma FGSC 2509]|nr:PR-1-like protein [Neurospora tetrasperma FGSC 2509]